ncbi:DUF4397 domain-containing protein [Bacillus testis]|uniref:DUF4397 domain-containing protein n=1 Tax=Bacillus testis TaxID=1622072 RepID=UPI00067F26F1|nr:DUF4397 domain-containing protein [Bacillus testis]
MPGKNAHRYFEKASKYALLADYYKYSNPAMHIHYYQKQLKAMQKAMALRNGDNRQTGNTQPARIRFLHAADGEPNVDVYLNGTRILQDFPYKKASDYLTLPPGKYHIDVYPTGDLTAALVSRRVDAEPGILYTAAITGTGKDMRIQLYLDSTQVPTGESKMRFIHLVTDAPPVDVAVKHGDMVFKEVPFRKAADYLGVTPMMVDLEVRPTGSKDVILPLPNISLQPNTSYTIFAIGTLRGNEPLEAIILVP